MNVGGPAYHVSLLAGRMGSPFSTLLATGSLAPDEGSFEDLADRYGAHLVKIPGLGPQLIPHHDLRALLALIRLIRRTRPDIVHTHTAKAGFLGRTAALFVRPRPIIVHTYHGHVLSGYFGPLKTWLFRTLERLLAHVSDRLIAVSESTKTELVDLRIAPPARFEVIPIGLDLDRFLAVGPQRDERLAEEIGARTGEVICTFVGRLAPIKRVDVLLDAMARVDPAIPLRLAVVGDGEQREEMETRATELAIESRVHFLGFRHDLDVIAAGTDVAILSSDNEGTPVALIEAAAAARPAIATRVGGVPDIVTPKTGRLVPRADAAALAEAIEELATDASMRREMGRLARRHVTDTYSAARLVRDVGDLYRRLLSDRPVLLHDRPTGAGGPEPLFPRQQS